MSVFKGSAAALVTPFTEDGAVDFPALEALVDFHVENGTDALVVCGTTGEAATLTDEEQIKCVRTAAARAAGRIPVIAGAGSNDTAHGARLSRECQAAGADALLLVTPYYNKCSQRGLIAHYTEIAGSVDIPVILYSVKSRTGVNIEPETALTLSKIPNITGIKEASGDIEQIAEIACLCGGGFDLYSGDDCCVLPVLSYGGSGVISVAANLVPRDVAKMTRDFFSGDFESAKAAQLRLVPLVKALFCEVNPIPVKAAASLLGRPAGGYRKPLCPPSPESLEKIRSAMKGYGLL
ncbi:MAG: 4-hydroxy-tetrahydrodipicolinate synthase [Clostridiales bacterium]|jgi:4-hydroxy-tetrahydrodipicolinate synthase|nr:4-hydroxy-tetrahydrodipicolinate synthase [Clostridiales bacterium]